MKQDSASVCRIVPARGTMHWSLHETSCFNSPAKARSSSKRRRFDGTGNSPQSSLVIDRDKANALGVSFEDINTTLSAAFGSSYANDFDSKGRQQRVIVQLEASERMTPEDFNNLYVRNMHGTLWCRSRHSLRRNGQMAPIQLIGYNGYPAMRITGSPG